MTDIMYRVEDGEMCECISDQHSHNILIEGGWRATKAQAEAAAVKEKAPAKPAAKPAAGAKAGDK